ncbi:energy transducer TonB [Candidatus Accumulibacter phosphatis]|jgi:protein TonB|uniref:Energy transducer TonB n=1 Tax=Candidatus Accumulibacter phosphatis TaxID=327160 RepID=A0ABX1TUH6_9PROT|nr:energy transducer TonB [Candidatus Accumulibacter phosphatis]NMQ27870.1 energy transducer TonB [Candidatus Accumulibacter phosphatis]
MPPRLILALALSLALHASLLLPEAFKRSPAPPPPILQAMLRLPVKPPQVSAEPLLKNTLASTESPPVVKPPPPPKVPTPRRPPTTKASTRHEVEAAQRKLSEHLYYPEEAVARGIEGEVRLILTVSDNGSITDVHVGVSSGHAILDKAAERAAWAMGKVNWAYSRELILPVIFRLE